MSRSKKMDSGDYNIGYGRPPKSSQFKPGQSGNPAGRKRSQPTMVDILRQILNERVEVQINGERKKLKKHELLIRGIVNRAVNGEVRASKQALDLMKEYGLLKPEDVEHHVVVELVRPKVPGKSEPESNAKPESPKSIPPLGSRKR